MKKRKKKTKKILVDMSCTLIHHGHIRLIKKAKKYGKVFVALCSDQEIKKRKKIIPELKFSDRKEIVLSIKGVSGVVKSKYVISDNFFKKNKFDLLVHGSDNQNLVNKNYTKIFKRTKDISSFILRKRAAENFKKQISTKKTN